jgi:hypothetical protein
VIPFRYVSRSFAIAAAAMVLTGTIPGPVAAANKKHHIGFALGYERLLSDDLKDESIGVDFRNSGYGALQYRLSVKRNIDLTLDARATTHTNDATGVDLTLTNSYWGPGIRVISPNEGMRPYVQANFLFVQEEITAESGGVEVSDHENGAGFGICGGIDIHASDLLSIPIEANFMYGKPADDISGIGINVGLTFNFGTLNP